MALFNVGIGYGKSARYGDNGTIPIQLAIGNFAGAGSAGDKNTELLVIMLAITMVMVMKNRVKSSTAGDKNIYIGYKAGIF